MRRCASCQSSVRRQSGVEEESLARDMHAAKEYVGRCGWAS
jgi:hypothetical protein